MAGSEALIYVHKESDYSLSSSQPKHAIQTSLFNRLFQRSLIYHLTPARAATTLTTGGIDVNNTVMVPNKLILRLEKAAARGSVFSSSAVPTALELLPSVMPRVM